MIVSALLGPTWFPRKHRKTGIRICLVFSKAKGNMMLDVMLWKLRKEKEWGKKKGIIFVVLTRKTI